MSGFFQVTYDVTTPESAENGEYAESGYVVPGGWRFSASMAANDVVSMSLRDAVQLAGGGFEDSGRWFTTVDTETNYRTGAETRYSIHPPRTITPASYRRLARLLKAS